MSNDLEEINAMSQRHFIGNWPYVINMANSIIGVSVLALPFCFKECGILLGLLLLMGSAWLTQLTCYLLMKSSFATKKRSYEYLAFHVFGRAGKLLVEVSIIGLLIGTCIAFYIIIGDLGPAVVSKVTSLENTPQLRSILLVLLTAFVVLPVGMLHSLDSLSSFSAISLTFYCVFVTEVIVAAFPNLWSGVWVSKVVFWNTEGVFKCLPIFALCFACQTQLFLMSESLPEPSLNRVNKIVHSAIVMCSVVYVSVGIFGYIAFCDDYISGDILMNFRPTFFSEAIKLGFVTSTLISFPLVIFPCRASIYTLLFVRKGVHENFGGAVYIPSFYFKLITISIIGVTLTIGILVPNIEFMLAITGATMGSLICYILPAVLFIAAISTDNSNSRAFAQLVFLIGITVMLASSYVTLTSPEKVAKQESVVKFGQPINHVDNPQIHDDKALKDMLEEQNKHLPNDFGINKIKPEVDGAVGGASMSPLLVVKDTTVSTMSVIDNKKLEREDDDLAPDKEKESEKRQEPPNPHAPVEEIVVQENVDAVKKLETKKLNHTEGGSMERVKKSLDLPKDLENSKPAENPPGKPNSTAGSLNAHPDLASVDVPQGGNQKPPEDSVKDSKWMHKEIEVPSPKIKEKALEGDVGGKHVQKQDAEQLQQLNNGSMLPKRDSSDKVKDVPVLKNKTQMADKDKERLQHKTVSTKTPPGDKKSDLDQNEAIKILDELRKQQQEQRQLLDEHRKIIDDLKRHQIEAHQDAPEKKVEESAEKNHRSLEIVDRIKDSIKVEKNSETDGKRKATPGVLPSAGKSKDDRILTREEFAKKELERNQNITVKRSSNQDVQNKSVTGSSPREKLPDTRGHAVQRNNSRGAAHSLQNDNLRNLVNGQQINEVRPLVHNEIVKKTEKERLPSVTKMLHRLSLQTDSNIPKGRN